MLPYTTIPVASAFFLVLVGVFIGNLIWARYRDEQEHLADQLKTSSRLLKQRLRDREHEVEVKSHALDESQAEVTRLSQELESMAYQVRQASKACEASDAQLAQERQAREDLAVCLADEERAHQRLQRDLMTTESELESLRHDLTKSHDNQAELTLQADSLASAHQMLQETYAIEVQAHGRVKETLDRLQEEFLEQSRSRDQLQLERYSLRGQVDSVADRLELAQQDATELKSALAVVRSELELQQAENQQVRQQLGQANTECATLRDELQRRNTELRSLNFAKAKLADRLVRNDGVAEKLMEAREEAKLLRIRLRQAEREADESRLESDDLREKSKRLADQLETTQQQVAESELRQAHLASTHSQQEHETRMAVDAIREEMHRAEERVVSLEKQLNQLRIKASREKIEAKQLVETLRAEADEKCNLVEFEMLGLKVELDTARKRITQLDDECRILRDERDQFRNQRDEQQAAGTERLELLASLEQQLEAEKERAERFALGVATTESRLQSLMVQSERLEGVEDELIARDQEVLKLKSALSDANERCVQAIASDEATRAIVAEIRGELEECLESLNQTQTQNADLLRQLDFERHESERWKQAAGRLETQFLTGQNKLDELQQLQTQLEQQLAESRNALSTANLELADYQRRCQRAQERVDELSKQLDESHQVVESRRQRRFGSLERTKKPNDKPFSFRGLRERSLDDTSDQVKLVEDPSLGPIYVAPPSEYDDLKQLAGIDDDVEAMLHGIGVYRFHQIAVWDETILLAIATRLGLAQLPWQAAWVEQARERVDDCDDLSAA